MHVHTRDDLCVPFVSCRGNKGSGIMFQRLIVLFLEVPLNGSVYGVGKRRSKGLCALYIGL